MLALTYLREPLSLSKSVKVSVVRLKDVDWFTAWLDLILSCPIVFIPVGIMWAWLDLRGIPAFLPTFFFVEGAALRFKRDVETGIATRPLVRLEHELVLALILGLIVAAMLPELLVFDEDLI